LVKKASSRVETLYASGGEGWGKREKLGVTLSGVEV